MQAESKLGAGEELLGRFWLAGADGDPGHIAAGVLDWSATDGVKVRLIGPLDGWPRDLAGPLTVHGETVEGDRLSVIDCLVTSIAVGGRATLTVGGPTLVLGDHTTADTRWRSCVVGTANLHEWIGDTGLQVPEYESAASGHTIRVEMTWEVPASRRVSLPSGQLAFSPSMDTKWSIAPDWAIHTGMETVFTPRRAAKLDALHRAAAAPILSLIVVAGDRPDSVTSEVVYDARANRRGQVLRSGERVAPREWRPDNTHLFKAEQLEDFEAAVQTWFAIWAATEPALGTFAESINMGATYSPARFLQVVSALESYGRRWRRYRRRATLLEVLEKLRADSGVPTRSNGCTRRNLKLMVASRNYHAHLSRPSYGFSPRVVENTTFESTRRATALMQGCLLRELGFDRRVARELLDQHYRNWPIPL